MLTLDKSVAGEGGSFSIHVLGQPSPSTNPQGSHYYSAPTWRQLGHPVIRFSAPELGYQAVFNLYEKYRLPSNQPGITEAVRVLKSGAKFEVPMRFTEEYKR